MAAPPAAYSPLKRIWGIAVEAIPGTGVAPTIYVPFDKLDPSPKPTWLEDKGIRANMGNDSYAIIAGVQMEELDFELPGYADVLPYLFANLLGDVTATGTATTPTGTLAASSIVGATSVSSTVSIPTGTLIQIDSGNLAEIVTTTGVPTGAGPYTIPVPALTKPHAGPAPGPAAAITAIQAAGSFAHAISLMNSGQGRGQATGTAQPSVMTWTQAYGPATRQYSYVCITELTITWNAETEYMKVSGKAVAYWSTTTSQPTPAYSSALPIPSWRAVLGLAGPASGGTQVLNCESGEYTIKRPVEPHFVGNGSQNPILFQRGGVTTEWKNTFIASDETDYNYMRNNTQPQYQWVISNGQSGANALAVQLDMQQAAFTEAKPNFGKEVVQWDCAGKAVYNTTNGGYSGGQSPVKVTFTNAITPGSYV